MDRGYEVNDVVAVSHQFLSVFSCYFLSFLLLLSANLSFEVAFEKPPEENKCSPGCNMVVM